MLDRREQSTRARKLNPMGLPESQLEMHRAVNEGHLHNVFHYWGYDVIGTVMRGRREIAATADVRVANSAAKNEKQAKALAKTALIDNKFDAVDISFRGKNNDLTRHDVDVEIRPTGA